LSLFELAKPDPDLFDYSPIYAAYFFIPIVDGHLLAILLFVPMPDNLSNSRWLE